jgi:hypothetical protein
MYGSVGQKKCDGGYKGRAEEKMSQSFSRQWLGHFRLRDRVRVVSVPSGRTSVKPLVRLLGSEESNIALVAR